MSFILIKLHVTDNDHSASDNKLGLTKEVRALTLLLRICTGLWMLSAGM